ncbi:hypothetical protein BG023_111915 [Porphyrobacter sp. LM 6]|nr:hypothetical protein BG023_111915 [Porphyrobacter sp. LM 6]
MPMSRIFLIDDAWDKLGEERTAKVGEPVLIAKIRFEQTAKIQQPGAVRVHGLAARIDPQTPLRRSYPAAEPHLALPAAANVYCTGRYELDEAQRFSYPPGDIRRSTKYKKFEREIAICLVDDEGDESFERAFISGAVSPDALPPVPVAPIVYRRADMEDPEGTQMEVRLVKESKNGPPFLQVFTNIHQGRFAGSYVSYLAGTGKMEDIDRRVRIDPAALPRAITYQDAQITVLSYDPVAETLRYRIDRPFTTAMVKIQAIFYPGAYTVANYQYE